MPSVCRTHKMNRCGILAVMLLSCCMTSAASTAADGPLISDAPVVAPTTSDRLLLTAGVSQLEGSAGGGLTPWAVIGGYGTREEIGANAFNTHTQLPDYRLDDAGLLIGFYDRVELSFAQQRFDTGQVGAALGLGEGFTFRQNIFGVKVRLFGDAVLDQDSWLPQVSAGIQHKKNDQAAVLTLIGARSDEGNDYYVNATKLFLSESLLANATLRFTKANQIGILGFGGDKSDSYQAQWEGSLAYLLSRQWAVGVEYRQKPNNLGIARETDWYDVFVVWAPTKHVSLTLAYVDLGTIVIKNNQRGVYSSIQIGF
jgi:hypothetical protein